MLHALGAVPVVADALDADQVAEAVARVRPDVIVHQLTAIRRDDRHAPPRARLRADQPPADRGHRSPAVGRAGRRRAAFRGAELHVAAYARTGASDQERGRPGRALTRPADARERWRRSATSSRPSSAPTWTEGIVLRYGWFYGPGTSMAPGQRDLYELVRKRKFPLVGNGGGCVVVHPRRRRRGGDGGGDGARRPRGLQRGRRRPRRGRRVAAGACAAARAPRSRCACRASSGVSSRASSA